MVAMWNSNVAPMLYQERTGIGQVSAPLHPRQDMNSCSVFTPSPDDRHSCVARLFSPPSPSTPCESTISVVTTVKVSSF